MGRIVGDLEFTVDANTGRLSAKLAKDGEKSGLAWSKAFDQQANNIGGAGLDKRLAEIRAKAEAALTELGIDVEINDSAARADIARLDGYLKASALELKINPDVDNSDLIQEIQETRLLLRGVVMNIGADLKTPEALRVKAAAEAILGKIEMQVEPEVDESALLRTKTILGTAFRETGERSGSEFGSGLSTRLKAIIGTIAVSAQPAAVALEGVAAAATAVLGSALAGATTGVAALATQFVGLANVAAATGVGFAGFGSALSEINKEFAAAKEEGRAFNAEAEGLAGALANLSPSAQDSALAFADLRQELADSQALIQERLFDGVADELDSLSSTVIPNVTDALLIGADQANDFGKGLAEIGRNTDFADIFERLEPTMENLFDAGLALVRTIEPFLKAAAPAAEDLSEAFEGSARAIEDFVKEGERTGDLTEGLQSGIESLTEFGDLLVATGDLLATIFSAGQDSGDGFVETLTGIISGWDDFLEGTTAGQEALDSFFSAGESVLSGFAPVLEGLKEGFSTLVDGDALASFDRLAEALGGAIETAAVLLDVIGSAGVGAAFLELFNLASPVLELLNDLDPSILQFAGSVLVASKAVGLLKPAIEGTVVAVRAAGIAMAGANPIIAGLTVTLGVALYAMQAFGDANQETKDRANELKGVLGEVTAELLEQQGATVTATLGVRAIGEALINTGEDGTKLRDALIDVGVGAESATNILVGLKTSPVDALTLLAESAAQTQFGLDLTAEQAARVAAEVNRVDQGNFEALTYEAGSLANELGLTDEQAKFFFQTLEEIQDQEEKTDFSNIISEFNTLRANASDYSAAVQELIPTSYELSQMTEVKLVEAYQAFSLALEKSQRQQELQISSLETTATSALLVADSIQGAIDATKDWAFQTDDAAKSTTLINDQITDSVAANRELNDAFTASAEAAFVSAEAEEQLERAIRNTVREIAAGVGVSSRTASEFEDLGDAAGVAADQADSLSSALDVLFGRGLSEQDAFDAVLEAINGFGEAAAEAEDSGEGFGGSLEGASKQAIDFRGQLRDGIQDVLDYGVAALDAGLSNDEAAAKVRYMTSELIRNSDQFISSGQSAGDYLATLGLTPDTLATVVSTPGLIEALLSTEDLNYQLDTAGNPVVGGITLEGLDPALIDSGVLVDLLNTLSGVNAAPSVDGSGIDSGKGKTDDLQEGLDKAADTTVDPGFEASDLPGVQRQVDTLQETLDDLHSFTAKPSVTLPTYQTALTQIASLTTGMETLDGSDASPSVTVEGVSAATTAVYILKAAIDSLYSRTITVTANQVGNLVGESMTGRLVTHPIVSTLGERGYKEAVIPLDLPLNRVDPSVREMAALVRGEGPSAASGVAPVSSGGGDTHNWTINEVGDGKTTARRVINRMAVALT